MESGIIFFVKQGYLLSNIYVNHFDIFDFYILSILFYVYKKENILIAAGVSFLIYGLFRIIIQFTAGTREPITYKSVLDFTLSLGYPVWSHGGKVANVLDSDIDVNVYEPHSR